MRMYGGRIPGRGKTKGKDSEMVSGRGKLKEQQVGQKGWGRGTGWGGGRVRPER